jgi:hypothetical protein
MQFFRDYFYQNTRKLFTISESTEGGYRNAGPLCGLLDIKRQRTAATAPATFKIGFEKMKIKNTEM